MKFLIVKERESREWIFAGALPYEKTTRYNFRRERNEKLYVQRGYVYPRPSAVSCFIEDDMVIEAEGENEAKRLAEIKTREEQNA